MTSSFTLPALISIIPYQELLGNYDQNRKKSGLLHIIPYQELLGNYDLMPVPVLR